MAASKLYPTLSTFYRNNFVGFGSKLDGPPANDLHNKQRAKMSRGDNADNTQNNQNDSETRNRSSGKGEKCYDKNITLDVRPIYPNLPELAGHSSDDQQDNSDNDDFPLLPSAPPIDLLDETFINFIQNAIAERNLTDAGDDARDETPVVDYSTLNLPSDIVLDDTWVDDLLPDYDLSNDEIAADFLNNLNVELSKDRKYQKEKSLELDNHAERSPQHKTSAKQAGRSENAQDKEHHHRQHRSPHHHHRHHQHQQHHQKTGHQHVEQPKSRTQDKNGNVVTSSGHRHAQRHQHHRTEPAQQDIENRPVRTSNPRPEKGASPGSPEYNAWMTWRKQVNRQLATVILLRRGAQVKIQRDDMSRDALNQRSIDFVSQIARKGNKTSLGGKPYVMYGIPRVSLTRPDILY